LSISQQRRFSLSLLWRLYNYKREIFSKGEEDKEGREGKE